MFDLEKSIKNWLKSLRKNQALEDGYIAELESHLRDEFENLINSGMNEAEAFEKAIKNIGLTEDIGTEYYKSDTRSLSARPPWQANRFMPTLLSNYLKIAFRYTIKNKGYSLINIVGLATGLACTILILLWVQDELSFEQFHENSENIYRLVFEKDDGSYKSTMTPIPLAEHLSNDYPDIEYSTRYTNGFQSYSIEYNNKTFVERIGLVDPSFFKIFTFPLLKGNYMTAFKDPYSIIISEKMAKKYFGSEEAIGKTLQILSFDKKNMVDYKVSAVMKDIPHNSHLQASCFIPFKTINKLIWWINFDNWGDWSFHTYVLLQENTSIAMVEKNINDCVRTNTNDEDVGDFSLQNLSRIHLYSNFKHDLAGHGDIRYVLIFFLIAFFILLIACINFINLSTARSVLRAKEVGLRKTIGATKTQLIKQFFGESILYSIISLLLSIILVELLLPTFNQLTDKYLYINYSDFTVVLKLLGIALITGMLSGSYPTFVLCRFNPVHVFKRIDPVSRRGLFRKILVVVQFSISIIIIICTIVVFNQLGFIRQKNIGFNKENVIYMPLRGSLSKNYNIIKNEIIKHPHVQDVTASDQLLTYIPRGFTGTELDGNQICENINIGFFEVDYNFIEAFNIKISKGRNFSRNFTTDTKEAFIINESLAKALDNESLAKALDNESLIGKKLKSYQDGSERRIIGIVKDFNFESLHNPVKPLIIAMNSNNLRYIYVNVSSADLQNTIKYLENSLKKYGLESSFEYHFLDKTIENLYFTEQRMGKIFSYFAYLAILISCLGLFGLASFTTERRKKEIGVRKVHGASVYRIVALLSKEFTKWVLLANIIAWPIAWYSMNKWLENFVYRIHTGLWIFLLAGGATLIIALLTVSSQAIKAATRNPVDSLRYE